MSVLQWVYNQKLKDTSLILEFRVCCRGRERCDLTFSIVPLCNCSKMLSVFRQHLGSSTVWMEAITFQKDGPHPKQVKVVTEGDPRGGSLISARCGG